MSKQIDVDVARVLAPFKFQPCRDYVVVKRVKHDQQTTSGLYLPESAVTDENQCMVIATGPKVADGLIEPGATVLVEKYDGRKVHVDGVDYIVLPEEEVLGVYSKE
jgi:chaperonin GroES